MKSKLFFLLVLTIVLFSAISFAHAEIQRVRFYILGHFNNYQEWRMKRALRLWVDSADIKFEDMGNFVTVVDIRPPKNKKLRIRKILKQLKDTRMRGEHSKGGHLLWRSEATVVAKPFRYEHWEWPDRYPREQPALWITDSGQKVLLTYSKESDKLQMRVNKKRKRAMARGARGNRPFFQKNYPDMIVKGDIVAFDGHYPVLAVKTFGDAEKGLPKKKAKKRRQGLSHWIPFF